MFMVHGNQKRSMATVDWDILFRQNYLKNIKPEVINIGPDEDFIKMNCMKLFLIK